MPLAKSMLFLSYIISTSFDRTSFLFISSPTFNVNICFSYSSLSPIPYIQDTDATTITSFALISEDVA